MKLTTVFYAVIMYTCTKVNTLLETKIQVYEQYGRRYKIIALKDRSKDSISS